MSTSTPSSTAAGANSSVVRILISSPGDVAEERDQARRVIGSLQRHYPGVRLEAVLWEELVLPATASFQESIDYLLGRQPIDVAVFILWSRLGSPLGAAVRREDGSQYRSGTEREFDLMLAAFERSGRQRPVILAYTRNDEAGFRALLNERPRDELGELLEQRNLTDRFIREQFHDEDGRNLRAYFSYSEPVGFAQRLHTHLKQVLDERLGQDGGRRWLDDPYRGLEHFDVGHAAIFHGRDAETCDLLQRLRDREREGCAAVVVVGASGSGKSSLARAGVAATLVQNAFDGGVKDWRVVPFLPGLGESPLLPRLVAAFAEKLPELTTVVSRDDVAAVLAEKPSHAIQLAVAPAFQKASADAGGPVRVLLLLDQMEELWTGRHIAEADRTRFLSAVEALARCGHVAVLATLRSDFYPHAQQSEAFLRLKENRGHFDLLPPGPAALQRLITEPARLAGVTFERSEATGQSLDQVILQDAARDPSALPLLEYALDELYRRREEVPSRTETGHPTPAADTGRAGSARPQLTFAAYERLGGVEGALGQRAAETFARLPEEAQAALPEILPLLVTIDVAGERSAVRRRAPMSELIATPARRTLSETLIAARFLTTDHDGEIATASLSHEALLRRWEPLAAWVRQNRDHLQLRARLEQSERRWHESDRHPSLLLSVGLPLEEGRQLLHDARGLLGAETAAYVTSSIDFHDRQSRRRRRLRNAILTTLCVLTLLATAGGIVAWQKRSEATAQRNIAVEKTAEVTRKNAEVVRKNAEISRSNEKNGELLRRASAADLAGGKKAWQELADATNRGEWVKSVGHAGKWHEAMAYWARSLELDPTNEDSAFWIVESFRRHGQSVGVALPRTLNHAEGVVGARFSPDGLRIVTASQDHTARIWDDSLGVPIGEPLRHESWVISASFSPDGVRVVTSSLDRTARLWDVARSTPIGEPLRHEGLVVSASFSPDGTRVVTASHDKTARLWDATRGTPIGDPLRHEDQVSSASFSPDGTRVVTASRDKTARLWDSMQGTPIGEPLRHESYVHSASFSPDGTRIVTTCFDRTARLWDAERGGPIGEPLRHEGSVQNAIFSPDGTRIVTVGGHPTARLWDAGRGEPIGEPLRHDGAVNGASFSPDGARLATASADGSARLWDAVRGTPIGEPLRHDAQVYGASFSPDGTRLVTASADKTARRWIVGRGTFAGEPLRHEDHVRSKSFDPDGMQVFTSSYDGTERNLAIDPSDRTVQLRNAYLLMSGFQLTSAGYSPDGRRIVTAGHDGTARIWNSARGTPIGAPLRHGTIVWDAGFSPDGTRVFTYGNDKTVRIWDVVRSVQIGRPLQHELDVRSVRFSPDGKRVVTSCGGLQEVGNSQSRRGYAQVWDAALGTPVGEPLRHEDVVWSADYSPDGARIVTASDDKTARIWDAESGRPIGDPLRHEAEVRIANFSSDGGRVVTASQDGTARIWDARRGTSIGAPLRHERSVVGASFSPDGKRIVTVCDDRAARIWDAARCEQVGEPLRHRGMVKSARFSPDSTRIVTVCDEDAVRIWDAVRGTLIGEPLRHEGQVGRSVFSPDGTWIVSASSDASARIWDVAHTVRSRSSIPLPAAASKETSGSTSPNSGRSDFTPVPPSVVRWINGRVGLRFQDDGELALIPESERDTLTKTPLPAGPWADLETWLKSSGADRPFGWRSKRTVRQVAESERDFGSVESVKAALQLDPTVPLARLSLANLIEKNERARVAKPGARIPGGDRTAEAAGEVAQLPIQGDLARAAHYRRYDLDRLPEDADLWERAARILRELPDAQVGVGPKPIKASEAAAQADRRAAEIRAKAAPRR